MSHINDQNIAVLRSVSVRHRAMCAGYPSVEALARAAGLSYGHLWCCLSGRKPAGPKVIAGLLRVLPCTSIDDISHLIAAREIRTPVVCTSR